MPAFLAAQLDSTASLEGGPRFWAALHAQEEPRSHAARSEGQGCCREAAPKSLIFHVSTRRCARLKAARCGAESDTGAWLLQALVRARTAELYARCRVGRVAPLGT